MQTAKQGTTGLKERIGRRERSEKLEENSGVELWELGRDRFDDFNRFVWEVYREAFAENGSVGFTLADIVADSDEHFDRAKVCAVIHPDGSILGTWGLILKEVSDHTVLPVQKGFNLSTADILEKMQSPRAEFMFNGWRTAINKTALEEHGFAANRSIFIFDLLLRGLTEGFVDHERFLGVAEMEMLVLKYHRRIGIPWRILGDPHSYWGRERYPCAFRLGEMVTTLREKHPDRYAFIYDRPPV